MLEQFYNVDMSIDKLSRREYERRNVPMSDRISAKIIGKGLIASKRVAWELRKMTLEGWGNNPETKGLLHGE